MDPKEESRLLQLYDEVETDVESENDDNESKESEGTQTNSDQDPYAGSDDRDPEYSPPNDRDVDDSSSSSSNLNLASPPLNRPVVDSLSDSDDNDAWVDTYDDVPNFQFDHASSGIKLQFDHVPSPMEVFTSLWTDDVVNLLVKCTNEYGKKLQNTNRPKQKNARVLSFSETTREELNNFTGLCLLQGQIRFPVLRKIFSFDPLYYHPVFSYVMSGRRFEQLLRCFNCTNGKDNTDRLNKVSTLLNMLIRNYQSAYSPEEALALDESLLLHRGRLSFKQYIKGKKAKYGIKFFELCTPKGYTCNIEIYKGQQVEENNLTKLQSLVFRLLTPFLDKGHHTIMDNYYNSVPLSEKLLRRRTHTTGTLRSNRRGNPRDVTSKKLKRGEHKWLRKGKVYVSKWKDKRDVLCITTKYQPQLVQVANSYGKIKTKPKEVSEYNFNMAGVDRSDQLTSYYSCPRKSVRWYKKVMFHLLDVTVVNSFLLYREITKSKMTLLHFREVIIKELIGIPPNIKDGRKIVRRGPMNNPQSAENRNSPLLVPQPTTHTLEKIPLPEDYKRKSYFLRCRECSKHKKRGQTSWRCAGCDDKPPLCVGMCFTNFHS